MRDRPALLLFTLVALVGCRDRSRPQEATTTTSASASTPKDPVDRGGATVNDGSVTLPLGVSVPAASGAEVEVGSEPEHWVVTTSRYELAVWRAGKDDGNSADEAANAFGSTPATWKGWKTPDGWAAKYDLDSSFQHTFYGETRHNFGKLNVMCRAVVGVKRITTEDARKRRDDGLEACLAMKLTPNARAR
jgi:hypothetical protein